MQSVINEAVTSAYAGWEGPVKRKFLAFKGDPALVEKFISSLPSHKEKSLFEWSGVVPPILFVLHI